MIKVAPIEPVRDVLGAPDDTLPENDRRLHPELKTSSQLSNYFPCSVGPAGDSTLRVWAVLTDRDEVSRSATTEILARPEYLAA